MIFGHFPMPRVRTVLMTAAVLGMLTLSSCFTVPLGDPLKSKIDARLTGYWDSRKDDEGMFVVIAPFDEHVYAMQAFEYRIDGQNIVRKSSTVYRAWLTPVGGQQFMTLESLGQMALPPGGDGDRNYPLLNLAVGDKTITAKLLDPDFAGFKDVKTSDDLARAIERNIADPKIFTGDPMTFKRLDAKADKELLGKFLGDK